MSKPTIFVIGEVSSGKSSFINSLIGGYISNASLQRETFNPLWYQFSSTGKEDNIVNIANNLEAKHKENENKREKINNLKEEAISSLDMICDDGKQLPIRYGLSDMNIIDFPGINDSDDLNNKFLKAVENRIDQADLIIYITDSSRAFMNASEIILLNKITNMVEKIKLDGQFIDLIVVANKFDNASDDDLTEICGRIAKKINFNEDKIFRFSSHKLFINTIIMHKLNVFVPKYSLKEITKILQNSNVLISKKIKENLMNEFMLKYNDIEYAENLEENMNNNSTIDNNGDWNNIINYLTDFSKKYTNECF